jgi:hypothetical protein
VRIGKLTLFFAGLILIIPAISAKAQIPLERLDFGAKIGTGISHAADYNGDSKSRTGYLGGALVSYRQNRLVTLQLEFLYIIKGYRVENVRELDSVGNVIGQGDFDFIFNYIEMPFLAKITLPVRGKYSPYFVAGGFAAFNIDNKMRLDTTIPFDFDIINAGDLDYGLIVGAGLDIKAGDGRVFIESRYDISFGEVVKQQNQKLRMLTFQIGYGW